MTTAPNQRSDSGDAPAASDALTVPEVATSLRLSQMTVRRYVADGRLPAVKIGRVWRISREAIERIRAALKG